MSRRLLAPLLVGVTGLVACALVYSVDPSQPGHYPPCPTKVLTGLDCPFCGSLRATHELMHGNLLGAADLNVTVYVVLPAIVLAFLLWTRRRLCGQAWSPQFPRWATVSAVMLLLVFTVVRNLPGMPLGTSA